MSDNSTPVVPSASTSAASATSAGTVGMVIKCCIERYFEIFDEVPDRSEAIPVPNTLWRSMSSNLSRKDSTRSTKTGSSLAMDTASAKTGGVGVNGGQTMTSRSILNGTSGLYATVRRPRSFISVEKTSYGRRGSVRFRVASGNDDNATIKSSAAGVEALGVTAVGLFSSAG